MKWILLVAVSSLVACGTPSDDFGQDTHHSEKELELTAQERADLLPNSLFRAVYNNNAENAEQEARKSPFLLSAENKAGDTPLGMALGLGYRETSLKLVALLDLRDFKHLNSKGASYVWLAARSGFEEIITQLADRYYNSLGKFENFNFATLDQPNADGQRALFVALNQHVAEALRVQYYRGRFNVPLWQFTLMSDNNKRSFLHQAAAEGREDVILWAVRNVCDANSWEANESSWASLPSSLLTYAVRALQTNVVGDLNTPLDLVFNRRDKDNQTALHIAIQERRWKSVRALASCRWLDYDLTNSKGNSAIQEYLNVLNPYRTDQDADAHETFRFLLAQNTKLRWTTASTRVNRVNNEGDSSLHMAAKLADPYFYNLLLEIGDRYALDARGRTAESIFLNRQQQASAHDQ